VAGVDTAKAELAEVVDFLRILAPAVRRASRASQPPSGAAPPRETLPMAHRIT
jgi:hypothetical protein